MHRTSNTRINNGFSLVEALVALVVLSAGMLGIAGLYVESLRSGRTALLRSQAVILAADMADRIRGNRQGFGNYEANVASTNTNSDCETGGAGCATGVLARHDKAVWIGAIEDALPGGTGQIDWDATTSPDTYAITITWSESGQVDPNTYVLRFQA